MEKNIKSYTTLCVIICIYLGEVFISSENSRWINRSETGEYHVTSVCYILKFFGQS